MSVLRRTTRISTIALLVLLLAPAIPAAPGASAEDEAAAYDPRGKEPRRIVDETVTKVIGILADSGYKDPAQRPKMREKVRVTILSTVDMKTVAALTLANYRTKFSPEQYKTFVDLLSQLLFSTYITHLEKYSGEKVVITGVEKVSEARVRVKTETVTDTKRIPVDFGFLKQGDRWMLYDVHVEGVSLIKNYRSQFAEILIKRSPDRFLVQLRDKVRENEKSL